MGVSALHVCDGDPESGTRHFYIAKDVNDRELDDFHPFSNQDLGRFIEVNPIESALRARGAYLSSLQGTNIFKENLDPEFGFQPYTTLDLFFFELPDTLKEQLVPLKLASPESISNVFY